MAQSIKDIVALLRGQGYDITVYRRKDGGYLIKEINGIKYEAAKGNIAARNIVGVSLSEKQTAQMSVNIPKIIQANVRPALSGRTKYLIRKTQKIWKASPPKVKGKITTKKIRESIEAHGLKEAERLLGEAQRYATGLAYSKTIDYWIKELEDINRNEESEEIQKVIDYLKANQETITEAQVKRAFSDTDSPRYKYKMGALSADQFGLAAQRALGM
jgi:predicted RNA-binding protein YlxR (DUF448 family)